jgi:segregation and condensation protein B
MRLTQIIEALLFASDAPLSAADLSRVDERLDEDTVEAIIQELRAEYELSERSFQIYEVAGGYQLLTRPDFVAVLERYDSVPQPSRLSAPALEVLAIISYRQPLGRAEIEDIRGVGSSGVLRTLVERGLVEPVGRGEGLGRPLLYGTTSKFLEHFGFRSLEDLPRPDELPIVLRERPRETEPEADPTAPAAGAASGEVADAAADATREDVAGATPAGISDDAPNDAADAAAEGMPDIAAEGVPGAAAEDVPDIAAEDIPDPESEDIPDTGPEDVSDVAAQDVPDVGPAEVPDITPEDIADVSPEDAEHHAPDDRGVYKAAEAADAPAGAAEPDGAGRAL